jgi:hypothetical protein
MESNFNKPKDYYLELLKQEILAITNDGENNDAVYLHNDLMFNSKGILLTESKYYNPTYDPETQQFTISRLIPSPTGVDYNFMQDYVIAENSDVIYGFITEWQAELSNCLPVEERVFSSANEVEAIGRFIADGLRLPEQEAIKLLRKHRKRLKSAYGIDNGDIPSGKFMEMAKIIFNKIFHEIEE